MSKDVNSGWTTAAGMYIGHYIAWIAAALLYAVYIQTPEAQGFLSDGEAPPVAPGPLAYNAIGVFGIITVIIAGWTTAELANFSIIPNMTSIQHWRHNYVE